MDEIYDFSSDRMLYSPLGGSDRKIPVEHDGHTFMLKFAEDHAKRTDMTTSHVNSVLSEYISSHISESAGLDTQKTVIGLYRGEVVVGCEDFRGPNEQNFEFGELVHRIYDSNDIARAIRYDQLYETIEDTLPKELRQPSVDRYWDTFVIDALVGNFDRHMGNWGYLIEPDGQLKIAPVYDYGSTLLPQLAVKGCKEIINDEDKMLERCLVFPSPSLFIGHEKSGKVGYYDMLASNFDENCTAALLRMQPKIEMEKIDCILDETPMLPDIKREFLKKYIGLRKDVIIDRAYKRCLAHEYDPEALRRIQEGRQYSIRDMKQDLKNGVLHAFFEQTPVYNKFIMIAGASGADSQKLEHQYYNSMPGGAYIRIEDIRKELHTGASPEDEQKVRSAAYSRIHAALEDAKDVVFAAANPDTNLRRSILEMIGDIPDVKKILAVIYEDPAPAHSEKSCGTLCSMAQKLPNNEPEYKEGWDEIDVY